NYAERYGSGIYVSGGELVITGTDIISNTQPNLPVNRRGGGIFVANNTTLTMTHSLVANNPSEGGAGIYGGNNVNITLSDSTIEGNTAMNAANFGFGGGIFSVSSLLIENSTISNNVAGTIGAGIRLGGGNTVMINSTVSGNQTAGSTGGIHVDASATANISFSTIVSNTGTSGVEFLGTTIVSGSIIAYNTLDCAPGLLTDGGYNLDSDGSCGLAAGSSLPNTDPLLLPLADNGGATATHWPLFASPVRDAVPTGVNGCGTTILYDQRGEPRPQGAGCDMGAVEAVPNSAPVAVADSFTATEDITLTVAVPGVLLNDSDAEGQTLTAVPDTIPSQGTLDLASSGAFTYT
ncbi:MAG: hypothetical protein KC443_05780, partial [Anaerolineales bacterium]|nr:hypothetical protein [Anaerolineales bacterium]